MTAPKSLRKKRRSLLITLSVFLTLILLTGVWFFWLPKRPFLFLSESRVESVQYCYEMTAGEPHFVDLPEKDQQKFISSLQKLVIGKRASAGELSSWSGGEDKPTFLITMKNGSRFYVAFLYAAGPYLTIGLVESPVPKIRYGSTSRFRISLSKQSYDAYNTLNCINLFCQWDYGC